MTWQNGNAGMESGDRRESKGAATWFVARCPEHFAERNRMLWLAQTMLERGLSLPPPLARVFARARLQDEVTVLRAEHACEVDDGAWIRYVEPAHGQTLTDAIAGRWSTYQAESRARFGQEIEIEIRSPESGEGLRTIRVPGKHRYMKGLGAAYWSREVLRRCRHLRPQLEQEERLWTQRGRGPRPDLRTSYYPARTGRPPPTPP